MGRAFEFRKERKLKRWGHMAKTFTKLGKEITIAVKQGGAEVTGNPRLRALIAEANGDAQKALSFYKEIKDQWGSAPEALEIDKYITRIESK